MMMVIMTVMMIKTNILLTKIKLYKVNYQYIKDTTYFFIEKSQSNIVLAFLCLIISYI